MNSLLKLHLRSTLIIKKKKHFYNHHDTRNNNYQFNYFSYRFFYIIR